MSTPERRTIRTIICRMMRKQNNNEKYNALKPFIGTCLADIDYDSLRLNNKDTPIPLSNIYSALVEGDYLYVLCNNCVFYAICLGDGTYVVRMLEKAATPWERFIWRSHYFFHRFLCLPKTYSIYLRT